MTGHLAEHVAGFAHLLRGAGVPIGNGQVLDATRALIVAGVRDRAVVRAALAATLTTHRDHREVFEAAFTSFWRDPTLRDPGLELLLPRAPARPPGTAARPPGTAARPRVQTPGSRRLADGWGREPNESAAERDRDVEPHVDVALAWSDRERLRTRDFEQMSAEEWRLARRLIEQLRTRAPTRRSRRSQPHPRGTAIDLRATLRSMASTGGDPIRLQRRRRQRRPSPIVVICDVSGSMERYSRVVLHFAHTLLRGPSRVHVFVFGTRLTNVTRALRHRDVDVALRALGEQVGEWSGGTRIGGCLHTFNQVWNRRVLGGNAMVLLITDGLDRDPGADLAAEAARLRRSCGRLIWLNPLLRYVGFEPRAAGVMALLPNVDEFRPVHDLRSLEQLAAALADPVARRQPG